MTLPEHHRASQIRQDWQQCTEQAIEAGRAPLLELGMDRQLLNNLPLLLALTTWSMRRSDLTQPLLLTGDVDALWPVPLFYVATPTVSRDQQSMAPSLQIVYGGADRATYLASLTTQAPQRIQSGTLYAVDLPVAMQPLVSAQTQPHVNASWQLFPLALLQRATADQARVINRVINRTSNPAASNAALSNSTLSNSTVASAGTDPWLAWATLAMIVLLVLLAMFV